jgi:uncharacterized protein with FMN-binding domain
MAILATVVGLVLLLSFKTPDTAALRLSRPALVTPAPAVVGSSAPPTVGGVGASPTASATGLRDGQYTGQDVPNDYGDVQVQVTISGGRITDVQPLVLPSDRQRSAEISQYAGPILHDEVLRAQSAQIDTISGATYTSQSYAGSVQSALDQAHA